ncbi:MAG: glycosyltransferase [Litorimonas sp.]
MKTRHASDPVAAVCVPAKNEAALLPGLIQSVCRAFRDGERRMEGSLVIALDGCTDGSADVVDYWRAEVSMPIVTVELPPHTKPNAGRVRKAAMDRAAALYPGRDLTLLTTDADTQVDPSWIRNTLSLVGRGADVVCGDVWREDEHAAGERIRHEAFFHAVHRFRRKIDPIRGDAADPHPKHYGASIAFRRSVYQAIGGCPSVPNDEDVTMVRAARLAGFSIRQDRSVRVVTSVRRSGRARHGLADSLILEDACTREGRLVPVIDPVRQVRHSIRTAALRRAFAARDRQEAMRLGVHGPADLTQLLDAWTDAPTADAFVTRVFPEPKWPSEIRLDVGERRLAQMKAQYGRRQPVRSDALEIAS